MTTYQTENNPDLYRIETVHLDSFLPQSAVPEDTQSTIPENTLETVRVESVTASTSLLSKQNTVPSAGFIASIFITILSTYFLVLLFTNSIKGDMAAIIILIDTLRISLCLLIIVNSRYRLDTAKYELTITIHIVTCLCLSSIVFISYCFKGMETENVMIYIELMSYLFYILGVLLWFLIVWLDHFKCLDNLSCIRRQ